jgi:hypothetical protein
MHSESFADYSGYENSKSDGNLTVETDTYSTKKRKRSTRANQWSDREEERILKYALKLSEKEHKNKFKQDNVREQSLSDLEPVYTYVATEEELKNPIGLFDKLWAEKEHSSGIIKIVPPESWIKNQRLLYESNYKSKLQDDSKKLCTRIQQLNQFYTAKVN